ncbi:MAG: dihydrolipoamide acetyltransferase family protein [Spirosomataceae bacterium]
MALIEMVMPQMGESILEATVLTWLKKPGERIETDESLLEVATDKVDTEVPSTQSGILRELLVQEGEVAVIGKPICRIEVAVSQEVLVEEPVEVVQLLEKEMAIHQQLIQGKVEKNEEVSITRFYSPLVLNICKEEGISTTELEAIVGTGAEGRVTKKDIFAYLEQRNTPNATPIPPPVQSIPVKVSGEDEIIQMDRMRKMIAERMVASKQISPHVTSFVETDMTAVAQWRDKNKGKFQQEYAENLTFTPLLIEAVVKAIKDFPMINCSVDGDKIIKKRAINIGMAVALPNGNLIVPVIHQADQYNLVGLAKKVNELTRRARENQLKPDDLAEGTYTVSNIGTFGNIMGTPIIVQPQVAIMAFGAIQKKPAVIETPQGDLLGIRQKMFISHSYDHRIVDGSLGGQFVKRVSDYLEQFDTDRKFV